MSLDYALVDRYYGMRLPATSSFFNVAERLIRDNAMSMYGACVYDNKIDVSRMFNGIETLSKPTVTLIMATDQTNETTKIVFGKTTMTDMDVVDMIAINTFDKPGILKLCDVDPALHDSTDPITIAADKVPALKETLFKMRCNVISMNVRNNIATRSRISDDRRVQLFQR